MGCNEPGVGLKAYNWKEQPMDSLAVLPHTRLHPPADIFPLGLLFVALEYPLVPVTLHQGSS